MRKFILFFIITLVISSCKSSVEGEGAATAYQEFELDNFDKIEVNCYCDVTLIPSTSSKVVVETHQNLLENIVITSKNNKLVIKENKNVTNYSLNNVNIYFTDLQEIKLNQQAELKVAGTLKADKMQIEIKDQASVFQTYVDFKELKLTAKDQSKIELAGLAINLNLQLQNQAQADLEKLQVVDINFTVKDNALATISPLKSMSGKASDTSKVFYSGDPVKDVKESDRALIQNK